MSDLDQLRELTGQFRPPPFGDLEAVSGTRRRRSAMAAGSVAAVVVIGAVTVAAGAMDRPASDTLPGAPTTSHTESVTRAEPDPGPPANVAQRLGEIRDQGSLWPDGSGSPPMPLLRDPGSDLTVQLYGLCDGGPCPPGAHGAELEGTPRTLEVSQGERSALFDVYDAVWFEGGTWWLGVRAHLFDGDSVLVQDVARVGGDVRFRLLQADGTSYTLRKQFDDPAPARPAPGVMALDGPAGKPSWEDLYLVDDRAATIRPLDVPDDRIRDWAEYPDRLMGIGDECLAAWVTEDGLHERQLDCGAGGRLAQPWTDLPDGWLQPGRMVAMEWISGGSPYVNEWEFFVHVTTDDGRTWQRVSIGFDDGNFIQRVADALRDLQ